MYIIYTEGIKGPGQRESDDDVWCCRLHNGVSGIVSQHPTIKQKVSIPLAKCLMLDKNK